MGIIPYQAFFFFSVMAAFFMGRFFRTRDKPWWWMVPVGWVAFCVLWTMVMVFMPGLMLFQFGVIAAATIWSLHLMQNSVLKRQLQDALTAVKADGNQQQARAIEHVPKEDWEILGTKEEHDHAFDNAIATATTTLCITSGWINGRAMHQDRVAAIRAATERGVHVFIAFGYHSPKKQPQLEPDTVPVVTRLYELAQHTKSRPGGKLLLAYTAVHSKFLVRDADLAVIGSKNWLSSSSDHNAEHGFLSTNPTAAAVSRDIVMRMVKEADAEAIPRLLAKANGVKPDSRGRLREQTTE